MSDVTAVFTHARMYGVMLWCTLGAVTSFALAVHNALAAETTSPAT